MAGINYVNEEEYSKPLIFVSDKMERSTWDKVYELPLILSEYGSYVWSSNDTMSLQFNSIKSRNERQKIVNAINGSSEYKIEGIKKDGCDFYVGKEQIFSVRGWGHLTGSGALNFPEEKALEIQNGFIDHVLNSLK